MRPRRVPLHSKRFHRKLVRKAPSERYLFWLQCKRPRVYARLQRWWSYRWLEYITNLDPWKTPFLALAPKVPSQGIVDEWRVDPL